VIRNITIGNDRLGLVRFGLVRFCSLSFFECSKKHFLSSSSGKETFPEVTICAAYEISYKSEVLDKHKIHMEQFRRNFKYPNVSNLTGNSTNNM